MATDFDISMPSNGSKMRTARLSAQQFEVLMLFMAEHPQFALGRSYFSGVSYSREEHEAMWLTLAQTLNDTEGPTKPVSKWQKCWVDLKSNARSRAAKLRASSLGGTIPVGTTFTPWDERVLKLLTDIGNLNGDSQLVEVALTNGKVVLMEQNGTPKQRKRKLKNDPSASKSIHNGSFNSILNRRDVLNQGDHYDSPLTNLEELVNDHDDIEEVTIKSEGEYEDDMEEGEIHENVDFCVSDELTEEETYSLGEQLPIPPLTPIQFPGLTISSVPKFSAQPPPPNQNSSSDSLLHEAGEDEKRKKRKLSNGDDVNDSLESFSKRLSGELGRMATAAEEANSIQRGMVDAVNRLASSFEQLVPVLAKVLASNSSQK